MEIKNNTEFSDKLIDMLADYLGVTRNEAITKLRTPWALKQFLAGKLPSRELIERQTQQEARLGAALRIVRFIEVFGIGHDETVERFMSMVKGLSTKEPGA